MDKHNFYKQPREEDEDETIHPAVERLASQAGLPRRQSLLAMTKRENGSILVWILIAIALFAALSYAMMRDGGTGTAHRTMSDAQARLYASEIIAYGDSVRQAVQKMRINGVVETGIGFDNNVFMHVNGDLIHTPAHNPNCAQTSCLIFHPGGGGIAPATIPAQAAGRNMTVSDTAVREGHWNVRIAKMNGVGTEENDLVFVNEGIRKKVCMAINQILGVANPDDLPPTFVVDPGLAVPFYNGQSFSAALSLWGNSPHVHGKRSYCYTLQVPGEHKFYNYITVLIAR